MAGFGRRVRAATLKCGVLALLLGGSSGAHAWRPIVNDDLLWLHWEDVSTIPVRIATPWPETYAPEDLEAVVARSIATWAGPDCGQPMLRFDGAGPTPTFDEEDGVTTLVPITDPEVWNARFGATELARTLLISRASTGAIIDADIAINVGGFALSAGGECEPELYDLQSTLTHELGHVLGLDHSDVEAGTMYFDVPPGECLIRTLDDDDVAGICGIYPKPLPVEPGPEPLPEPSPEPAVEVVEAAADVGETDTTTADAKPKNSTFLGCGGGGQEAGWLLLLLPLALNRRRVARSD